MKSFIIIFILLTALACSRESISGRMLNVQTNSGDNRIDENFGYFRWLLGYVEYVKDNSGFRRLVYSYKAGSRQIIETFFLTNSELVYIKKEANSYYLYGEETVLLGEYFFKENVLTKYTFHPDEHQLDLITAQHLISENYEKAKSIILRNQKKLNGG